MLRYNKQVRSWLSEGHLLAPSCPFLISRLDVTTINKCRATELSCSDFTVVFKQYSAEESCGHCYGCVGSVVTVRGVWEGWVSWGYAQRRVWYWGWLGSGCVPRTPHPQINQGSAFICFTHWALIALYHGSPAFRRELFSCISWWNDYYGNNLKKEVNHHSVLNVKIYIKQKVTSK